jgi:hypothetical protein
MERHAAVGKRYQVESYRLNNQINKDLSVKIWLMHEALRSLPENYRLQAEVMEDSIPPEDRPLPLWDSPPIKGFDPEPFRKKANNDDDFGAGVAGAKP